jgi:hypothetical protein
VRLAAGLLVAALSHDPRWPRPGWQTPPSPNVLAGHAIVVSPLIRV